MAIDADDGLSRVDIEFSMDEGNEIQNDEGGDDTETEQSRDQATGTAPAPAGRGRITGSLTFSAEENIITEILFQ